MVVSNSGHRAVSIVPQQSQTATITVVVLAGGISRRLGRDKTVQLFNGETLIRRVMRRASAAAGSSDVVVVVADDGQKDRPPADIPASLGG